MAEFEQPPASRAAMQEAAQHLVAQRATVPALSSYILSTPAKKLAAQAGVSPRQAQRWQAKLSGKSSQKRGFSQKSLEKLAKAAPGALRMRLDATLVIGGDPKLQPPAHGHCGGFYGG